MNQSNPQTVQSVTDLPKKSLVQRVKTSKFTKPVAAIAVIGAGALYLKSKPNSSVDGEVSVKVETDKKSDKS